MPPPTLQLSLSDWASGSRISFPSLSPTSGACESTGSSCVLVPEGKVYAGVLVPAEVRAGVRVPESTQGQFGCCRRLYSRRSVTRLAALASRSRVSRQRVEDAKAPARAGVPGPRESATLERLSQRRSELLPERRNQQLSHLVPESIANEWSMRKHRLELCARARGKVQRRSAFPSGGPSCCPSAGIS